MSPAGDFRERNPAESYSELGHPADLLLEITGDDLPGLFENALFALYDHVVDLAGIAGSPAEGLAVRLDVAGPTLEETLRELLAEALYRLETERFVATGVSGPIVVEEEAPGPDRLRSFRARAGLRGEIVDPSRHRLLTEIKAVTYHRLSVEESPSRAPRWRATVLFDI